MSQTSDRSATSDTGKDGTVSALLRQALSREKSKRANAIFASAVVNVLSLGAALFVMQVVDRIIPFKAETTLLVLAAGLLGVLVFELLMRHARGRLLDAMGQRLEVELSQQVFNKVVSVPLDQRPSNIGSLAAKLAEFDALGKQFSEASLHALYDLPYVVLFTLVLFWLGGSLVVVPLISLPVLYGLTVWGQKAAQGHAKDQLESASKRHGMLVETLEGAETLKGFNAEGWFSHRWYNLSLQVSRTASASRAATAMLNKATGTLHMLTLLGMCVWGYHLTAEGNLSTGALVAALLIVERIFATVQMHLALTTDRANAAQARSNLDEFMADVKTREIREAQSRPMRLDNFSGSLQLENIRFRVGRDKTLALSIDKLQIAPGERVGIVGPTGSGKTSLLRIMSGLYSPSEGRCMASGVDMALQDTEVLRKHIAYLPQFPTLFGSTLKDNLSIGIDAPSDDQLLAICSQVGLDTLVSQHPRGINLSIEAGGAGLSGGQTKLVALGRVLAQKARIVLLDEPTGSLDPQSEAALLKRLSTLFAPDQTLVFVTHKFNLLSLVDRVIVIDNGTIRMDGPRDEIMARITVRKPKAAPANGSDSAPVAETPT
jgi:ATP-binding cassette subfamily C protein LapB